MSIDFHAHILPGLDHGCADVQTALLQLRRAKKAGVACVAATSHFYPHIETAQNFLSRRTHAWNTLREHLGEEIPRVILGAEVLVCDGIEKMDGLLDLGIGDSTAMLIEMPPAKWKKNLLYTVERINARCGGRAILAHVERYNEKDVELLFEMGVLGQVNAASLFRLTRRRRLLHWIDSGFIAAFGSDIHNLDKSYDCFARLKPMLGERFEDIIGSSGALLNRYEYKDPLGK